MGPDAYYVPGPNYIVVVNKAAMVPAHMSLTVYMR